MKSVVIGAHGVIGSALHKALSSRFSDCIGLTTKSAPHLTKVKYDLAFLQNYITGADAVIYCCGVTKFADCEQYPEESSRLNCDLPSEIMRQLLPDQFFIYFSSPIALIDFGSKNIFNYALHKRMAEKAIEQSGHDNYLIIRPSKVIESASVLREWKASLGTGKNIAAFADQFISPINTALLSTQLLRLLEKKSRGAYNFSARDRISYADLAGMLCAKFGLNSQLIEKKSARTDNRFYFEQDILDCARAEKEIGYAPPLSKDVVNDYLQAFA